MSERDTHFQGFAKLQMPVLDSLFILLYQAYAQGDTVKRDEYSQRIQTFLAQCAYDLFYHVMDHAQDEVYYPPEQWLGHVPDLVEWPVKRSE